MLKFSKYFTERGMKLEELGRRGRPEADWMAVNSYGGKYPVEEKSAAEALKSYSSWWSYWKKKEEFIKNFKNTAAGELPSQIRGWIAGIDGQLRDWVTKGGSRIGYLASERASAAYGRPPMTVKESIDQAAAFLQEHRNIMIKDAELLSSDYYVLAIDYGNRK